MTCKSHGYGAYMLAMMTKGQGCDFKLRRDSRPNFPNWCCGLEIFKRYMQRLRDRQRSEYLFVVPIGWRQVPRSIYTVDDYEPALGDPVMRRGRACFELAHEFANRLPMLGSPQSRNLFVDSAISLLDGDDIVAQPFIPTAIDYCFHASDGFVFVAAPGRASGSLDRLVEQLRETHRGCAIGSLPSCDELVTRFRLRTPARWVA